ncbi:alanine acetyltransferase [Corynebacterium ulcerans]|uniref:GNAT family N-acetyltransferase n=1 Tax=Corynebacterium ulcerans TaxID=65058 RepID=UPI0005FEAB0B|nr:GNAT family protein [Corynebacterium ulcerans]AKA96270.1 Ribosomal-protein-alanine acetyltransferase [Corynebacterium ulcerans]KKO85536.1 alanine acetyltransferase [Corynebacterium ulcerans]KKO87752.1 alanine acetyltransferase [Corynebacterium ulcerans]KPJ24447.1 alanine acetyltransferase [Corynebacterium ulcerans]BDV25560.1 acetyltransferase [Corynebacterium ulcerans]
MSFLLNRFGRQPRPARGPVDPVHPGWGEYTETLILPGTSATQEKSVRLRPLQLSDGASWRMMRLSDREILEPVEPTVVDSWETAHSSRMWRSFFFSIRQLADMGNAVPFAIELEGKFVGQLTLGGIQHGAISECWIGYWVHSSYAGQGIATAACGLGVDHAFKRVGLHRVTATFLPENVASRKILEANGFREEGYLQRNLHIFGEWRDHFLVALTDDEFHQDAVTRLMNKRGYRRASS